MDETDDIGRYKVVINHEEQYSIWPEARDNPLGWTDVGVSGSKSECLDHIDKVWTDMRPLSLRKWLAENPVDTSPAEGSAPAQRDLVEFLAAEERPVALVLRGVSESERFKSIRERNFLQLRFPTTEGGTELTMEVDRTASELSALEREPTSDARIQLVGRLELDYRAVECRANIRLSTLEGTGRLHPRSE